MDVSQKQEDKWPVGEYETIMRNTDGRSGKSKSTQDSDLAAGECVQKEFYSSGTYTVSTDPTENNVVVSQKKKKN